MANIECATYSVAQAARRLGVSRAYAYELIRRGQFPTPTRMVGTRVVVVRADLEGFIVGGENALDVQTKRPDDAPRVG